MYEFYLSMMELFIIRVDDKNSIHENEYTEQHYTCIHSILITQIDKLIYEYFVLIAEFIKLYYIDELGISSSI